MMGGLVYLSAGSGLLSGALASLLGGLVYFWAGAGVVLGGFGVL